MSDLTSTIQVADQTALPTPNRDSQSYFYVSVKCVWSEVCTTQVMLYQSSLINPEKPKGRWKKYGGQLLWIYNYYFICWINATIAE